MPAIVFQAQLVNPTTSGSAELARIIFGTESLAEKEVSFRAKCKEKYPDYRIEEPLSISASRLNQ